MLSLINGAFARSRTAILLLLFILVSGGMAYQTIPKEADPDVAIPMIYVSISHEGISPEDAERLLIRPMEKELQSIEGLQELEATAAEGHATILLEFDAGFDAEQALTDVRERVDIARVELPDDTDEPRVQEVNVALFPVLTVVLSGPVPERTLVALARDLQDRIETLPGVLEAELAGNREELLEVVVDPLVMDTYGVAFEDLLSLIGRNNRMVAAGALDSGAGRMVVKVPGVIESIEDVQNLPVKVVSDRVVTFGDVANIYRTYKDPEGFARIQGEPAVALEVSKRVGANIIETIEAVRGLVATQQALWPGNVAVNFLQDQSKTIRTLLGDLQNNVLSAVALVMVVILAALGARSALLVGIAIPGSFLAGILVINFLGYTLNIVTLFSLILVAGMLVDGAIVVTELANRYLREGLSPREAYRQAARRMSWPVVSSTATTLAVFLPLLFWPGVVGEFMKYLPMTVLITLGASLFMALVFVPVLGGVLGRSAQAPGPIPPGRLSRAYREALDRLLHYPLLTLLAVCALLVGTYMAYGELGKGVEFFPDVEPDYAQVQIHARGDLSVYEKDQLVQAVEEQILGMPELRSLYTRTFGSAARDFAEDVIGLIQLEFVDWRNRRPASMILDEARSRAAAVPGVVVETRKQEGGPSTGKPIELELAGDDPQQLAASVVQLRGLLEGLGGLKDLEDSRPLPGIEWRLEVDRREAARYGADVVVLGNAVQLVTTGIQVTEYRPDDIDEEVDVRVRYPYAERHLHQLDQLRVTTARGLVPASNFVRFVPAPRTGTLSRVDGVRVMSVAADVEEGVLADTKLQELRSVLAKSELPHGVSLRFKGEDADQQEAMVFLGQAFVVAVFVMAAILVTQFNSFYQAALVLSAVVFSTAGVLLGLLITGQPFGIVMCGIGIIALAGIVVNNNIVLIDTFNVLRGEGLSPVEAARETAAQRLRPVLLTSVTTILGLIPMVLGVNVDLLARDIAVGAPSTQWWTQLSSSIAGGLAFATLLTLLLTPCMLVLGEQLAARLGRSTGRGGARDSEEPAPGLVGVGEHD